MKHDPKPSRAEAIRRLLEKALGRGGENLGNGQAAGSFVDSRQG